MYFVSDCGITDPPEGEELTDSSGRVGRVGVDVT